jgi:hypothetical protein
METGKFFAGDGKSAQGVVTLSNKQRPQALSATLGATEWSAVLLLLRLFKSYVLYRT